MSRSTTFKTAHTIWTTTHEDYTTWWFFGVWMPTYFCIISPSTLYPKKWSNLVNWCFIFLRLSQLLFLFLIPYHFLCRKRWVLTLRYIWCMKKLLLPSLLVCNQCLYWYYINILIFTQDETQTAKRNEWEYIPFMDGIIWKLCDGGAVVVVWWDATVVAGNGSGCQWHKSRHWFTTFHIHALFTRIDKFWVWREYNLKGKECQRRGRDEWNQKVCQNGILFPINSSQSVIQFTPLRSFSCFLFTLFFYVFLFT